MHAEQIEKLVSSESGNERGGVAVKKRIESVALGERIDAEGPKRFIPHGISLAVRLPGSTPLRDDLAHLIGTFTGEHAPQYDVGQILHRFLLCGTSVAGIAGGVRKFCKRGERRHSLGCYLPPYGSTCVTPPFITPQVDVRAT